MKHWLFTIKGKVYLLDKYLREERSTYDIARALNTYANLVRRALLAHGMSLRDRSEAQQKALESGRGKNPTEGQARPENTRRRIAEGVRRAKARVLSVSHPPTNVETEAS